MSEFPNAKVLVVDDQPINIKLLQRRLEREGMEVTTAVNGLDCLEQVEKAIPDIILLDVMMPEMDGIETCKRLKAEKRTRDIPVLFITARTSQEGKLEGLKIGAADYITKPIDLEETLARVNTQLRIQYTHRQNLQLQQRLSDVRRSAAIGSLTQGIAHNLNNLLGVVVGYIDLMKQSAGDAVVIERSVEGMERSIDRMTRIVRELSRMASEEVSPRVPCKLDELVGGTLTRFRSEYGRELKADVSYDGITSDMEIASNPETFETLMCKLLLNGVDAAETAQRAPEVRITIAKKHELEGKYLMVHLQDNGTGISPTVADTLFEPFVSTHSEVGRGLGLTMVRHAVKSLSGSIEIENNGEGESEGATVTLKFPI